MNFKACFFLVVVLITNSTASPHSLKSLSEKFESNSNDVNKNHNKKTDSKLGEYYGQPEQIHISYGCLYLI
jgi:hypothetical protein